MLFSKEEGLFYIRRHAGIACMAIAIVQSVLAAAQWYVVQVSDLPTGRQAQRCRMEIPMPVHK